MEKCVHYRILIEQTFRICSLTDRVVFEGEI